MSSSSSSFPDSFSPSSASSSFFPPAQSKRAEPGIPLSKRFDGYTGYSSEPSKPLLASRSLISQSSTAYGTFPLTFDIQDFIRGQRVVAQAPKREIKLKRAPVITPKVNCGTYQDKSGAIYEGPISEGKPDGEGIIKYPDGKLYCGWVNWNCQPYGSGTLSDGKGFKQTGDFIDGELYIGTSNSTDPSSGIRYEGEYKHGKRHGHGKITFPNGDYYRGGFHNNFGGYEGRDVIFEWVKIKGTGKITNLFGDCYEGSFLNGKLHGKGTLTFKSGGVYVGQFKEGKLHGHGTLTYKSGGVYVGQFKEGKVHGHGTLTYKSGSVYVGQFQRGKRHGQGTMTYPDGRQVQGVFVEGKLQR